MDIFNQVASAKLADIALEFARLCLGYDDARISGQCIRSNRVEQDGKEGRALFDFSDLDRVQRVTWRWCRRERFYFEIRTTTMWNVHVVFGGTRYGFASSEDFRIALLTACVAAARTTRATTITDDGENFV